MAERLMIFGASGHGRVIADAAQRAGWELVGWADDDAGTRGRQLAGAPVLAIGVDEAAEVASRVGAAAIVAIGNPRVRSRIFEALSEAGVRLATIVHPAAVVAPSATLGRGTVVVAGAVVNPDTVVGANSIINTLASVDHDGRLGDHVHVSPGAHLGGTVSVGAGTHIGLGASVRNNIAIGAWSVIGAGAVVVADVPDGVVAFGVPARVVRESTP